jgi:hypothetical protein
MSSQLSSPFRAAIIGGLFSLSACASGGSSLPATNAAVTSSGGTVQTLAKAAAGGGGETGGGGGGAQIPPPSTIDGPAWFVYSASAVLGAAAAPGVNFDALQNTVQGAISIGAVRSAQVLVFNTSKKTPLAFSVVDVTGPNAADFTIAPASVQNALTTPVPAKTGSAAIMQIAFSPSAEGARSATLHLVSNAGTVLFPLSGSGLPARAIIRTSAGSSLAFIPASAPDTIAVTNDGGQSLVLSSIALGGANPGAFGVTVANQGFSNCFAGVPLGPHSTCYIGVGLAAGAQAPSSGVLTIGSNDPLQPETNISLTLQSTF